MLQVWSLRAPLQIWGCWGREEQSGLRDHAVSIWGAFLAPHRLGPEREPGGRRLSSRPAMCCVTWGWVLNLSQPVPSASEEVVLPRCEMRQARQPCRRSASSGPLPLPLPGSSRPPTQGTGTRKGPAAAIAVSVLGFGFCPWTSRAPLPSAATQRLELALREGRAQIGGRQSPCKGPEVGEGRAHFRAQFRGASGFWVQPVRAGADARPGMWPPSR